jgi:Holliday junction resolvase RusA-like endonuclease
MIYDFVIHGETPSKKNSRINTRSGRSFPNKRYSEWHKNAMNELFAETFNLRNEEKANLPIKQCEIKLTFIHGDLRKRDSDNGTSSIFDTLKDSGIIIDDNWQVIKRYEVSNDFEKNKPCCMIHIEAD